VSRRITAAVLREQGAPLALEELELAEPGPHDVLVRVHGVGVCQTDVAVVAGKLPRPLPIVLGHEGAGIVEAVGSEVSAVRPGDAVVMTFDHCGGCRWCEAGRPAYCDAFVERNYAGVRADGSTPLAAGGQPVHGNWLGQSSFATHALASEHTVVKVAPHFPLELLGPLACSLMTGAGAILNVLRPAAREGAAVFGLGAVGLAAVMAARLAGCEPIVAVDPNGARRELALELGATHAVDPAAEADVVARVEAICPGGVACSVDAVGLGPVIAQALRVLRSPGLCATVGFQGNRNPVEIDHGHLLFGRGLVGVVEGDADPRTFIPRMLELYERGDFPFDRLIRTFPFERVNDALEAARSGAVVKPVVVVR
jgi:aryl-alcohol dehydrogenase